jgi:ribokinase
LISAKKPPRVIGLGALNVDRIFRVESLLADGESTLEDGGSFAGGSAANTIYGLSRLGFSTGFCGAVGDDTGAQLLLDDFKRAGTDVSHIVTPSGVSSGTVFCLSTSHKRSLYVLAGANRLLTDDSSLIPYINSAEFLHLSSFVDEPQFDLSLRIIRELSRGVKLSFSPGALYVARGLRAIKPFIERAEVLFINKSEIEKLTGEEFRKAAASVIKTDCKYVAVTLGKGTIIDGQTIVACVRGQENEWLIDNGKPVPSKVADTTGAGDAFAAGFLAGLLDGKTPDVCGRLGHCEALLSLKCIGARGGLPTRRSLHELYEKIY